MLSSNIVAAQANSFSGEGNPFENADNYLTDTSLQQNSQSGGVADFGGTSGGSSFSGMRPSRVDSLDKLFQFVTYYLRLMLPLIVSLAVVVIIFNVFKYFILKGDSAESHKQGATYIMFAVIALAAILSLWGLVRLVQNTFGFTSFQFVPQIQKSDV